MGNLYLSNLTKLSIAKQFSLIRNTNNNKSWQFGCGQLVFFFLLFDTVFDNYSIIGVRRNKQGMRSDLYRYSSGIKNTQVVDYFSL